MIDKLLYKLCSDPVKFLLVKIGNAETAFEEGYTRYYLNACEINNSLEANIVFTRVEKYVIRKALKAVAKSVLTKKIYGINNSTSSFGKAFLSERVIDIAFDDVYKYLSEAQTVE